MNEKLDLIKEIQHYYNKNINNFVDIQKQNRNLWKKYYSPTGFIENIINKNNI